MAWFAACWAASLYQNVSLHPSTAQLKYYPFNQLFKIRPTFVPTYSWRQLGQLLSLIAHRLIQFEQNICSHSPHYFASQAIKVQIEQTKSSLINFSLHCDSKSSTLICSGLIAAGTNAKAFSMAASSNTNFYFASTISSTIFYYIINYTPKILKI